MRSWVPGADGSGFGIDHLPYGVVARPGEGPRAAVRIGDHALDLNALAGADVLRVAGLPDGTFGHDTLNAFLSLGHETWERVRERLGQLLAADGGSQELVADAELRRHALLPLDEVTTQLPVSVGNFVDFYSSLQHATNASQILRPGSDPVGPNWRRLPVGYHGRAGTVVVSGTAVRRPRGLRAGHGDDEPTFGPERRLDVELELGFLTGSGPPAGTPIAADAAWEHIFGFVLVNDWSAREIQRYESQPLGPFLGKSFATSIAAWITPAIAVRPLLVGGVPQDPPPAAHLRVGEPRALDLDLSISLTPGGGKEAPLSRVNARELYWSPAQQLAHATSNGARVHAGDLFASGTISGAQRSGWGSLLELSWGGRDQIAVAGERRTFLSDGDTVVMRGSGRLPSGERLDLGEVSGSVLPAAPSG